MSGSYYIKLRKDMDEAEWNQFVNDSDSAWLWHRYEFQDILCTWPGRDDISRGIYDNNKTLIAILPLHVLRNKYLRYFDVSQLDSLGGMATLNDLSKKEFSKLTDFLKTHLSELAKLHHSSDISFTLPPMAPAFRGDSCPRTNPLLFLGFSNNLSQTWMINLSSSIKDIRIGYTDSTRGELKKIRQNPNFKIREASGEEDLKTYYKLHRETYDRTGAKPHPFEYFKGIFEKLIPSGFARILFFERDGVVVAAQNTAIFKKGCLYWTGASLNKKSGGENRCLMDDQISFAKEHGCEWYEMGEAFPNSSEKKTQGLNLFKRSFGGDLFPYYKGKIHTGHSNFESIKMVRSLLKI